MNKNKIMKRTYQKPAIRQTILLPQDQLLVSSMPIGEDIGNDQYSNLDMDMDIWNNELFRDLWK